MTKEKARKISDARENDRNTLRQRIAEFLQAREELEELNLLYQNDEKEIVNLQSELEHKKLAIKNRNTRIKNLKANLTGIQNALEQTKKQLAEATDIINKIDKYIIPHHGWTKSEREEQVELVEHAKKFLKENNPK